MECIPSDPSLEVEWFLVRDGSFIPLLGGEFINQQKKRNVIIFNNVVSEFPYYQITLKQVEVTDSGQYQCSIQPPSRDNTLIAQLIEVVVLPGECCIHTVVASVCLCYWVLHNYEYKIHFCISLVAI